MTLLSDAAARYLDALNPTGPVREQVGYFVGLYESLLAPGTLTEIFINDRIDEDGDQQFGSLWLIGPAVVAECSDIAVQGSAQKWDLAAWSSIKHLVLDSQRFDPDNVTAAARLSVRWSNDEGLAGSMSATGINCLHLTALIRAHLLPKMPLNGAGGAV